MSSICSFNGSAGFALMNLNAASLDLPYFLLWAVFSFCNFSSFRASDVPLIATDLFFCTTSTILCSRISLLIIWLCFKYWSSWMVRSLCWAGFTKKSFWRYELFLTYFLYGLVIFGLPRDGSIPSLVPSWHLTCQSPSFILMFGLVADSRLSYRSVFCFDWPW